MVQQINAIMLSGGSAFGLDAASGAMQYLEERNYGFDMKVAHVPIVCSASLFDLTVGKHLNKIHIALQNIDDNIIKSSMNEKDVLYKIWVLMETIE